MERGICHCQLTNYDWNVPSIGMDKEAEDVLVAVAGFGAAVIEKENSVRLVG